MGQDGPVRGAHHRQPHAHPDVDAREADILARLRADGGRVTDGRRAIVRALVTGPDHHVTAEDVAHAVAADHPDLHLSTVYRTLDALADLGVVDRIVLSARGAVYHLHDHAHHHLVCTACGTVVEVPETELAPLLAPLLAAVDQRHGFDGRQQRLALNGRCADCR